MTVFLLASHGSAGGVAAENAALGSCQPGDTLDHLYVIPSWWHGMTGDDWLNNGVSRNRFCDYLSEQLWQESQQVIKRVECACRNRAIFYHSILQVGVSAELLQQLANNKQYNKIFLGDWRPKGSEGIKDRMLTKELRERLSTRLSITPHPHG